MHALVENVNIGRHSFLFLNDKRDSQSCIHIFLIISQNQFFPFIRTTPDVTAGDVA